MFSSNKDDEFAVYRTSQVKIKYVVQYTCDNDKIKEFQPIIQTELEDQRLSFEDHDQPKGEKSFLKLPTITVKSVFLVFSETGFYF